jgi:hypothetical protein
MKYTLLELTQRILGSMDSDEVNTIGETSESLEVAHIIKECYFDIVGKMDLPEENQIFQLTPSADNTKPTLMFLPGTVMDLQSVKYNISENLTDPNYADVFFLPLDEFVQRNFSLSTDMDEVETMEVETDRGDFLFKFMNDRHPSYYTTIDDNTLIFDSYDAEVEDTLTAIRTLCWGQVVPTWEMDDTFIPDLDPRQFQFLLQASKAQAFVELKQIENPKAEKKERRNEILAQRTKHAIDKRTGSQTYRGYGRRGRQSIWRK